jgi:hypothetical protein
MVGVSDNEKCVYVSSHHQTSREGIHAELKIVLQVQRATGIHAETDLVLQVKISRPSIGASVFCR